MRLRCNARAVSSIACDTESAIDKSVIFLYCEWVCDLPLRDQHEEKRCRAGGLVSSVLILFISGIPMMGASVSKRRMLGVRKQGKEGVSQLRKFKYKHVR